MSTFLESKGITLSSGYRPENMPADADVIVIGNAMKRGNPEVEAVLNRKLYYVSLPELLKELFLRGRHNLVVTGTHGKTTTTSLLTWILTVAELEPSYVIGGLPANLQAGRLFNDSKYFVIEGDEYDSAFFDKRSKFVHYLPELLIVNNIEFDHADIFNNLDEIKLSFRRLFNIVPAKRDDPVERRRPNCVDVARQLQPLMAQIEEVGFSPNCARQISRRDSYSWTGRFRPGGDKFEMPLIGEFNVRNAAMAVSAAQILRRVAGENSRGAQELQGNRAPAGAAR